MLIWHRFFVIRHVNRGRDRALLSNALLRNWLGMAIKMAVMSITRMSVHRQVVSEKWKKISERIVKRGTRTRRMERGMRACWMVLSM